MSLRIIPFPAGHDFWLRFCQAMLAAGTGRDLSNQCVIVPAPAHAAALLAAFAADAAAQKLSLIPPRVQLLSEWLHAYCPAPQMTPLQLQGEIYAALRGNRWIRENFGSTPAQLWSLAHTLAQLGDQLCLAAYDNPQAFATTLEATLAQRYRHSAQRIAAAEARLVLEIWQTLGAAWPAGQTLRQMEALLQSPPDQSLWWLAAHALPAWQDAFLQQLAQRIDATLVQIDYAATAQQQPLYAAAWPQTAEVAPLLARAQAATAAPLPALTIAAAESLEQEAGFIARQVIDWLEQGETDIALIALDRLTTRRVRALLERAQVLVRDETGWRLSTTSACGAVMRWFDVVRNQGYFRDVLDWLQSPFVLPGTHKHAALRLLQNALARHGVLRGWDGLLEMLSSISAPPDEQEVLQQLRAWFAALGTRAQSLEKFSGTVSEHLAQLDALLTQFGLRQSLAADPVGRSVLQLLRELGQQMEEQRTPLQLAEFRALLAHCFEQANHRPTGIDSPVVVVSLRGAHLRSFRKVILIGAGADLLPATADSALFLNDALCAELGLPTQAQERQAQFECWLALLAGAQQVVATWRNDSDNPQALSPWLAQYRTVAKLARQQDVLQTITLTPQTVAAAPLTRPAPGAPGYWPDKVSASRYQALVDCPYRYFARAILGLQQEDEVSETPEQRERGQAVHRILENFHHALAQSPERYATIEAQTDLLRQHCAETFAPLLARAPDYLAWQLEFEHLVPEYLRWLQLHQAAHWQWQAAEQKLEREIVEGEHRLQLHGRVDRLDTQDNQAMRLIDYKTTDAAVLKKRLQIPGEEIQLPFYALLHSTPCTASYLSLQRSGVREIAPDYDVAAASRTLATRLMQDFVRIHAGAPMPAQGDNNTCVRCEVRGLCRRDEWFSRAEAPQ